MIQELLFTKAERGLRPGSSGFCTVLSTEGMTQNAAAALEGLSGYKHPFDKFDERSRDNPVNFLHTRVRIGGTIHHVLSRIADQPHERTAKLAHHVALKERELPVGGPAHVLRHPGFCREDWDGTPRVVQAVRPDSLPWSEASPMPCRAWQDAAGDAGWAGVVAEALQNGADPIVNVIFPLRTDALALCDEALRLISPDKRWEITFSTYYNYERVPGDGCKLRFVLDGTPAAEDLRRDLRAVKIDLASPLGAPPASELVTAARTGDLKFAEPAPRPAATSLPAKGKRGRAVSAASDWSFDDSAPRSSSNWEDADPLDYGLAPPSTRRLATAMPSPLDRPSLSGRAREESGGKWMLIAAVGAAVVLALVVIGSFGSFVALAMMSSDPAPVPPPVTPPVIEPSPSVSDPPPDDAFASKPSEPVVQDVPPTPALDTGGDSQNTGIASTTDPFAEPSQDTPPPPPVEPPAPPEPKFEVVELPEVRVTAVSDAQVPLATNLPEASIADVRLYGLPKLAPSDSLAEAPSAASVGLTYSVDANGATHVYFHWLRNEIDNTKTRKSFRVAVIETVGNELRFRWTLEGPDDKGNPKPPDLLQSGRDLQIDALRFATLSFSSGVQPYRIRLSNAVPVTQFVALPTKESDQMFADPAGPQDGKPRSAETASMSKLALERLKLRLTGSLKDVAPGLEVSSEQKDPRVVEIVVKPAGEKFELLTVRFELDRYKKKKDLISDGALVLSSKGATASLGYLPPGFENFPLGQPKSISDAKGALEEILANRRTVSPTIPDASGAAPQRFSLNQLIENARTELKDAEKVDKEKRESAIAEAKRKIDELERSKTIAQLHQKLIQSAYENPPKIAFTVDVMLEGAPEDFPKVTLFDPR